MSGIRGLLAGLVVLTMTGSSFSTMASAASPAKAKFVLGIVSISATESGNHRFITGAQAAARAKGWQVIVIDAHGSADEANAAMQNLATRKVNAMIDMVFPVTSLGAGLRAARQAHIPVGTWGGGIGNGAAVSDGAGGPLAQLAVTKMVHDLKGRGAILALTYHTGLVCRQREQVLDRILSKYPSIKVTKNEVRIPGYFQDGAQFTTGWLASHPSGSGNLAVWGCWDDPALGAISALKQAHRHDVKVYGENGGKDALAAINSGWMTATGWENSVAEGFRMVQALQQVEKAGSKWKPKIINVPGVLVDRKNVKRYLKAP